MAATAKRKLFTSWFRLSKHHALAVPLRRASSTDIEPTKAAAAHASDACTVMRLPKSPTVMPLKARSPPDAMVKSPSTRPRIAEGA